jgi:hypothetical protein
LSDNNTSPSKVLSRIHWSALPYNYNNTSSSKVLSGIYWPSLSTNTSTSYKTTVLSRIYWPSLSDNNTSPSKVLSRIIWSSLSHNYHNTISTKVLSRFHRFTMPENTPTRDKTTVLPGIYRSSMPAAINFFNENSSNIFTTEYNNTGPSKVLSGIHWSTLSTNTSTCDETTVLSRF